jgi:hypothetical protein
MKLAEALSERKALQDRVAALNNRARKSVVTVEGRPAVESPDILIDDIVKTLEQWEQLVVAINRANMRIVLEGGMTVMEALARRDRLTREIALLDELMQVILGPNHERMGMLPREMARVMPNVNIAQFQNRIETLSNERRTLDLAIQEAGWVHEV